VLELEHENVGPEITAPLIAPDWALARVDALSSNCTLKLKGPVPVSTPVKAPVPEFCDRPAGTVPVVDHENGVTPPDVEQVTVYCAPISGVPAALQVTLGAAKMVPVNETESRWVTVALSDTCSV
jgi:hypothetical protein